MSSPNLLAGEILRKFADIAAQSQSTVGVGVGQVNSEFLQGIAGARQLADIVLVGKNEVDGWDCIRTVEPERTLVDLLMNGTINAAVRGTVSATKLLQVLKERMKVRCLHRSALLSTYQGKQFFLVPVGIDEGRSVSDRAYLALKTSELLKSIGIDPAVGVLSGGRLEDKGRTHAVDLMLEHAEKLTTKLRAAGLEAVNYGILIEEAISTSNVLIAPDGISGNLIFRTLAFLGGGKGHGAPLLGIPYTFVDTSRSGAAFADAILIASALSFLAYQNTQARQRLNDK